ncbi:MAG: IS30 family transposase [Streptococcaceae bacterium]|jgi:IS30 family transposase|nr:IS30 family transposase [Streptococcaceae bacterium]
MQPNTTQPKKKYSHLGKISRKEIEDGIRVGDSYRAIAEMLGCHYSTISREVKRNHKDCYCYEGKYLARRSHQTSEERKKLTHPYVRIKNPLIQSYIIDKLKNNHWTPVSISGRLPIDHPGLHISVEAIYQWIYNDQKDLRKYLPRHHKARHKRSAYSKSHKSTIPNRVPISERPEIVKSKTEIGHWEIDTVVSKQSRFAVAVCAELKTRKYFASIISSRKKQVMHEALIKLFSDVPQAGRKTCTYDNGTENCNHSLTNQMLGTDSFFCEPYCSWEKGLIENRNGILRRSFPKKTDWKLISQEQLDKVIHSINSTPLKCLNFKTPNEVWEKFIDGCCT